MKLFGQNLVFGYFEDFDNIQLVSILIEYIYIDIYIYQNQ
jgi:hypothetical protein